MLDAVIEQIIYLKPTIITAAIGTILLVMIILLLSKRFSWGANNVGLIGLFYESTYFECILMSVCLIKVFLVISMMFSGTKLSIVHIVFYGVLVLVYNALRHSLKEVLISIFNGTIILGVLYISMFLLSYVREVLFDVKIVVALAMLSVFLIMYSLYDLMWSILNIVSSRPMTYNPKDVELGILNTATPEYVEMSQIKETINDLLPEPVEVEPIEDYLGTDDESMAIIEGIEVDKKILDKIPVAENVIDLEIIDLDSEE